MGFERKGAVKTSSEGSTKRPARTRDPDRRERILAAAAVLIADRGYVAVKLDDIGTAAGIVGSGIYRHFDSKVAILIEMFDRMVDQLNEHAERSLHEEKDPRDVLLDLIRDQVRFVLEERTFCKIYVAESRNLPSEDYRRLRRKQRHYIDLWQDALHAVMPELSTDEELLIVHSTIAVIQSGLRFNSDLDREIASESLVAMARRVLAI